MMWIVAYDIRNDGARTRVAKLLVKHGLRIQKSVFCIDGGPSVIKRLADSVLPLIDNATDRFHVWPLASDWQQQQLAFPPDAAPLAEEFVVV